VVYLFRKYGLDATRDVIVQSLQKSDAKTGLSALASKQVDAISYPSPAGLQAEDAGLGTRFICLEASRNDLPDLQGLTNCVIYGRDGENDVMTTKPTAVRGFIRAIAQAHTFLRSNPDQAKVFLGSYLKLKGTMLNQVYQDLASSFPADPRITREQYQRAVTFHKDGGLITGARYDSMVAASVIDDALKH
jgi:ABC-type nitrate/sulfonate/bicarbonate transport system substrate-binding protein